MLLWVLSFLAMIQLSFAEVGKITKILGSNDAYVMRSSNRMVVSQELPLEEGDEIFSQDTVILIHLYPSTQISMAKNTQIRIFKNEIDVTEVKDVASSVIDFIKGIVRLQVTKDETLDIEQKVVADGVAFAVRGTEFEVSKEGEDFDLDVMEGEVEVSSPFVQTFVPEIVKAHEGFRFNKKQRQFQSRKFRVKFKDHPGFIQRQQLKEKWKQKRVERKQKRALKKAERAERRKRKDRK